MKIRLDGKVALVTGGSRGIGQAIARRYLACGAKVMITARRTGGLDAATGDLKAACDGDAEVLARRADAADPGAARDTVAEVLDRFGRLDILVNNAGLSAHVGPLVDVELARYDRTQEVNQRGPLVWTQAAWRAAMAQRGGAVVNIASIGGLVFEGPVGVYDMTKAALIHQTKHLACELAPDVRVNAIAPGLVATEFARVLWERAGEDADYPWPLRRLGRPDDIADAALFLVSDLASWITGHVMVVDGGAMLVGGITG